MNPEGRLYLFTHLKYELKFYKNVDISSERQKSRADLCFNKLHINSLKKRTEAAALKSRLNDGRHSKQLAKSAYTASPSLPQLSAPMDSI